MWFILFLVRAIYLFLSQLLAVYIFADDGPEGMFWYFTVLAVIVSFLWTEPEEADCLSRAFRRRKRKK